MSRPSRGFSVHKCAPTSANLCPSTGSTELTVNAPDNVDYNFYWLPDVNVVTVSVYITVNGSDLQLIKIVGPGSSGLGSSFDPNTYANPEDTIELWAVCTDVVGCADFLTTPAVYVLPP